MKGIKLIIILLVFGIHDAFSQQRTAGVSEQLEDFYRRSLQTDIRTAAEVARIMQDYKSALYAVEADTVLNVETKRNKCKTLAEYKNRRLKAILSFEQQKKIIQDVEPVPSEVRNDTTKVNMNKIGKR